VLFHHRGRPATGESGTGHLEPARLRDGPRTLCCRRTVTTPLQALARLLSYFRKRELDREFEEELAAHVEFAMQDFVRQGKTHAEARRLALLKLGGMEASKELHRDSRGLPWLDGLTQDVRGAARALRRRPGFSATAVAVLALAIGLNAGVFTIAGTVLLG